MDFNTLKSLCRDNVAGKKLSYSADEIETSIRNGMLDILGTTEFRTKRDFHRAYAKHQEEIYEIIEDSMDQYILDSEGRKNAFFNNFVEVKSEMVGDTNEFYVDNDNELVVSKLSQGNWSIFKQRIDAGQVFGVQIGYIGIAIEEEYYRFISGRCDYPRMVAKMMKAIDDYLSNLAYDTFVQALTHTPTINQLSGAYNADEFAELISTVRGENGENVYVLGTLAGLKKIQATTIASQSTMSEAMKNQVNEQGYLSNWGGVPCVELPQGFKAGQLVKQVGGVDVPNFLFDDNQLFILSGSEKPVKMYLESPEMNRNWTAQDTSDMSMGEELIMGVGCSIAYNRLFGSVKLV